MGISQQYHLDYTGSDPSLQKLFHDADEMFAELYKRVNSLISTKAANLVQTRSSTVYNLTAAYADVTSLTVNITPRAATSKVRITACMMTFFGNALSTVSYQILRNGVSIQQSEGIYNNNAAGFGVPIVLDYLDAPALTTAVTYKIQAKFKNGGAIVNSAINVGDVMFSSITAEEVLQ